MNNYHTHTARCKHATGTPADYARRAFEEGCARLGISDHTPLPDGRWSHVRMEMEELAGYEADIETARREVPELVILKGAECEWTKEYDAFFREELLGKRRFDYLVGAIHWFPHRGEWLSIGDPLGGRELVSYSSHLVAMMESGLFAFIAHPDGFGAGYGDWDENARACSADIHTAAAGLGVPLEINGYGFRKKPLRRAGAAPRRLYPLDEFWETAGSAGVKAVCSSDAHKPSDVTASMDLAAGLAERFGVPVIDPFEPESGS